MRTGDTIVALASPRGRAARALVRLSGPAAFDALRALDPGAAEPVRGARAARLRLRSGAELPALTLCFPAPASYTGEHTVELLIPGNPHLVERVIDELAAVDGVRRAGPGEFSARAYLAGRLTLEQAEGVAHAISASSDAELEAARALLRGATGDVYRGWAEETASVLALVEAGIDFTDQEDVVAIERDELLTRVQQLVEAIEEHLEARGAGEPAPDEPTVVLAGRPSAGKSTLFNALLGRRRAVVAEAPGTTRDALAERLDLSEDAPGGPPVLLCDLPGLDGAPAGELDAEVQRRASDAIERADAIILCDPEGRFDAPVPGGRPVIRVRTKGDLAVGESREDVRVCALDGWNLGVLRRAIADAAGAASATDARAAILPRHRRSLTRAAGAMQDALALASEGSGRALDEPELVAGALRDALDALGELTGAISPDDVIGRVFATFCVGK